MWEERERGAGACGMGWPVRGAWALGTCGGCRDAGGGDPGSAGEKAGGRGHALWRGPWLQVVSSWNKAGVAAICVRASVRVGAVRCGGSVCQRWRLRVAGVAVIRLQAAA